MVYKSKLVILTVLTTLFLASATAAAKEPNVELRNYKFTHEEIINRNGKTLIQSRLAWVGYGGGNAFYLDTFESTYIGYKGYNAQDIVEITIIWNPETNYDDDYFIFVRPVRQFGLFTEKEEELFV